MFEQVSHELRQLLRSHPTWLLFLLFVLVNLFFVFWVERYFARNLADLRPFFEWLPLTVVAFTAALTMRMWSEERRLDRVQLLLCSSIDSRKLVAAKFGAAKIVLFLALLITLPLPVSISFLGDLDWGVTASGYFSAFLLGQTALAIGLFSSSRSDNQVAALLTTSAILFLLTLPGSQFITELFEHGVAEQLIYLGLVSRYEIMAQGVFDFGTLLYFLFLSMLFLHLNWLEIERISLAPDAWWQKRGGALISVVLVIFGLYLAAQSTTQGILRSDWSKEKRFTLSDTTQKTVAELQEPLTLHAFISARSHPLLNSLVPQIRDLLMQYDYAGRENLVVKINDPRESVEAEILAVEKFGIRPTTFQSADRYQTSVVNSYFDLVVEYGERFETLNYRDLIEMKMIDETRLEVQLRNPEYDLTKAIQRVVSAAKDDDDLFASLASEVRFTGYISSPQQLPVALYEISEALRYQVSEMVESSDGKLSARFVEPDEKIAEQILEDYGMRPQVLDPLDESSFFFYMLFEDDNKHVTVPLPRDLDKEALKRNLQVGLKRFQPGSLKRVGLSAPKQQRPIAGFKVAGIPEYTRLEKRLQQNAELMPVNLANGTVPIDIEILFLVEPHALTSQQLFALDQYLMRGGNLVIVASPWQFSLASAGISAQPHKSGLEEWLAFHGIEITKSLVLDSQNMAFPVPVKRQVGDVTFDQVQMLPYPYFSDIRSSGMEQSEGILGSIDQLTINWPSPISLNVEQTIKSRVLLTTSDASGLDDQAAIQPNFAQWPETGFPSVEEPRSYDIAVALQGKFSSWFARQGAQLPGDSATRELLTKSVEPGRLVLFAAGPFLSDEAVKLATEVHGSSYENSMLLVDQIINWATEGQTLQALRGQGRFARTLKPLTEKEQQNWEWFNYMAPLILVLLIYLVSRFNERHRGNKLSARLHAVNKK